jgi:hypothetical protein
MSWCLESNKLFFKGWLEFEVGLARLPRQSSQPLPKAKTGLGKPKPA